MSELKNVQNWTEYKEQLLEGVAEKHKAKIGVMMENVHAENMRTATGGDDINRVMVESNAPGATLTGNISRYDMMFMPMVRRTMPALLAMDLVGVQPISSPQGIVRAMKFRYSNDVETTDGSGVNEITAGTEASGQTVYERYSRLALGGAYDDIDGLNPFQETEYLEKTRGQSMDLRVVTDRVDTRGRKLSSSWSLEAQDDLDALDGLDIEAELNTAMGDEIQRELDREIVDELVGLAGTIESLDYANIDGRYAGEKLSSMLIAFDNLSAQIAMKTRRTGATWMVISQRVFTAMKNANNSTFVPANAGELQISSSLFVGTYGAGVSVYVDPYLETDTVLMGRKGGDTDTGLIYLPYIPLSSTGAVRDVNDGSLRLLMRTRYGMYKATDPENTLNDAADHYARATIANLGTLGFTN